MVTAMAVVDVVVEESPPPPQPFVPRDTFGVRLAILRADLGGWNVKRAADACGINDQSWRTWEAGTAKPRDLEGVCRSIADATGVDYVWLMVGGPLTKIRWSSPSPLVDDALLPLDGFDLALAG